MAARVLNRAHNAGTRGDGCFLRYSREEVAMLETYFVKPTTIDRIQASWVGAEVERYVVWLDGQGYRARSVLRRVPMMLAFGEFAHAHGAREVQDLPEHIEPFVADWLSRSRSERRELAKEVRGPVEQMLR